MYIKTSTFRILIIVFSIICGNYGFTQALLQTYQLQNGLTIILSPIESVQSVSVFTYIKTGVRDDLVKFKGASTLFKNIRQNAATRNFNYLEGLFSTRNKGGIIGSKVEYDYSYFYQIVSAEDIDIALMLEAERFKFLKINKRNFQIQKKRHIERLNRLIKYNAYYNSYLWANSKLFANSVYQYPLMGERDKMINLSFEDFKSVYERYSDPGLTTLVIVGKFKTVYLKKKITKYFSDIKKNENNKQRYTPLKLKSEYITKTDVSKTIAENFAIFGLKAPSVLDYSYTSFLFMKYFLLDERFGNISYYLKNNKLDVTIDYRLSDNIEANSLIIGISSKKKINIVKTRYLLLNYFRKLPAMMLKKKNNVKNIKNLMEIDYLKKLSGLVSRSEMLARSEHFFNNLDLNKNIVSKIKNISLPNIINVCKKYFAKDKIVLLIEYNEL